MKRIFLIAIMLCSLTACDFGVFPEADATFGTQNFVSAISIIELHKVRNGTYPETLEELEFLGQWDAIWLGAVRYEKSGSGYNLFVERGWVNEPSLEFPVKFKQGLGIQQTNVQWVEQPQI